MSISETPDHSGHPCLQAGGIFYRIMYTEGRKDTDLTAGMRRPLLYTLYAFIQRYLLMCTAPVVYVSHQAKKTLRIDEKCADSGYPAHQNRIISVFAFLWRSL